MSVKLDMMQETFALTSDDISQFKTRGFLKLKSIFSVNFIDALLGKVSQQIAAPKDNFGSQFAKFKYDILNDDEEVLELIQTERFAGMMNTLIGQPIFYVQGIGFAIDHKAAGFPWHVGTQSFGYQRLEDYGVTIWIPLNPIDPGKQAGGMAYVPKNQLAGTFVYQHVNCLPKYVSQVTAGMSQKEGFKIFSDVKHSLLNSPTMDPLLRSIADEDSFELGDALIFDKHIIHRSIPLKPGPIEVRHAFVMRFSSLDARYNKHAVEMLEYPRKHFAFAGSSDFNTEVCSEENQLIRESPFFAGKIEQRIVKNRAERTAG